MTDSCNTEDQMGEGFEELETRLRDPSRNAQSRIADRREAADAIASLRRERDEARKWAYAQRLEKFRSGCVCHIGEDDKLVSMCGLHQDLIDEALAEANHRAGLAEKELEAANNQIRELGKQLADTGRRAESAEARIDELEIAAGRSRVCADRFESALDLALEQLAAARDNVRTLSDERAAAQAREAALRELLDWNNWPTEKHTMSEYAGVRYAVERMREALAGPAQGRERDQGIVDRETAQVLLDLLNPLHDEIDRQTYGTKVRENFDAPADAEYNIDITARMERDLTQAVLILENRLRDPQIPATPPGGEPTQAAAGGEDDLARLLAAAVNSSWTALLDHCCIDVDCAPGTKAFWRKIARAMMPTLTRARDEGRAEGMEIAEKIAINRCCFNLAAEIHTARQGQPAPAGEGES